MTAAEADEKVNNLLEFIAYGLTRSEAVQLLKVWQRHTIVPVMV